MLKVRRSPLSQVTALPDGIPLPYAIAAIHLVAAAQASAIDTVTSPPGDLVRFREVIGRWPSRVWTILSDHLPAI
jgi:hypothetical protein